MLIKAGMYKPAPDPNDVDEIAVPTETGDLQWKPISKMTYTGKDGDDFDLIEKHYAKKYPSKAR
jgi:hypothetical protein